MEWNDKVIDKMEKEINREIETVENKINREIKVFKSKREAIINSEKLNLDIISLTEEQRIRLNNLSNYTLLEKENQTQEEENATISHELSLDGDFTNKTIQYLKIDNEIIFANNMKSVVSKFCKYLAEEDINKFITVAKDMDKVFLNEHDTKKATKKVEGTNFHINTRKNNFELAKLIARISKRYGIDTSRIKIAVEE